MGLALELKAYRYSIPFLRPFVSGSRSWENREGVLLSLSVDGTVGWGEAAPLPGVSPESMEEVVRFLSENGKKVRSFIKDRLDENNISPEETTPLPSLQFALDTMMADWHSQSTGKHLSRILFDDSPRRTPVNATLSSGDTDTTLEKAEEFWDQGFRTFKLKVGKEFDAEYRLLGEIRERWPDAVIRIDANQSWNREEAEARLARLRGLDIEYCEEPVINPDPAVLRSLMQYSDIRIALDESLNRCESSTDAGRWMESVPAEIAVVKPMIFGSFKKIFETYRHSVTHNYKVVFTTSLETGIGRMMTAFLASGLGSPRFANGLATGRLLKMDVWKDKNYIDNGYFNLPEEFGLGSECRSGINHISLSSLVV